MNCTRCKRPITEAERCASVEQPFCPPCWMIHFYDFPEKKFARVQAELDRHRRAGVDEETLKKLLWSALRAHAEGAIMKKLDDMQPWIDRMVALARNAPPPEDVL